MKSQFWLGCALLVSTCARAQTTASTTAATATVLAPLQYRTSWVGNTFGGGEKWVQNFAEEMHVAPDGTCVVSSFWDEAGREVGFYRDGDVVGGLKDTHMRGGKAVAVTDKYVFYAQISVREDQPEVKAGEARSDKPITFIGVSRWKRDGEFAPFKGGKTRYGNMRVLREVSENNDLIPRGLASDGRQLYVADTTTNRVLVFDVETLAPLRDFAVSNPERLALDAGGDLWVLATGGKIVSRFSPSGQKRALSLQLPLDSLVAAISFAPDGRLIVCDSGPRQQVLFFSPQTGKMVGTFGERGGMFAGPEPGKTGPTRFAGLSGAGFDARGHFYVACNVPSSEGGTVVRAFGAKRELLWEVQGLEFVDVADAMPGSDGRDLWTVDGHYSFDPDAPAGKGWKWLHHTLDPVRSPDDLRKYSARQVNSTSIRQFGGETFLCQRGMWQNALTFYRVEGGLTVQSAILSHGRLHNPDRKWAAAGQPESGGWLWRDVNGDARFGQGEYFPTQTPGGEVWGSSVDTRGDIWQVGQDDGIWRWRFLRLDEHKNPVYDTKPQRYPMPAPFVNLLRVEYLPDSDTLYLSGQTPDRLQTGGEWGTAGTVLMRFDNWSQAAGAAPKPRYRIDFPYTQGDVEMASLDVAGDLLFAVECKSAQVRVYDNRDGRFLGIVKPGPEVKGESGWIDIRDGLRATRLRDGSYLLLVEEDWKGKTIVYRLQNPLPNGA